MACSNSEQIVEVRCSDVRRGFSIHELKEQREMIILNIRGLNIQKTVAREPVNIESIEKHLAEQLGYLREINCQIKDASKKSIWYSNPLGNYILKEEKPTFLGFIKRMFS